jgi:AmmeMemoRadiSam system protein A
MVEQTKMLTKPDGKLLLELARKSIESHFSKKDIDFSKYKKFDKKQGVFVTLNENGELRGCIGFPYPTFELYKAVFDAAKAAAFEDPRFPPVQKDELKEIHIDISVLTVPEEMKVNSPEEYVKNIKIGEDGLIMKGGWASGLLLPQVFTEYKSAPKQALEMTCQKAGMSKDAWRDPSTKVFKFQAQIFEED